MAGETFDNLRPLFVFLGDNTFSFPEFRDLTYDNETYYTLVFRPDIRPDICRDRVAYYMNCWGKRISFEEFFEKCNDDTKEQIIFNLDFFRPTL